MTPDPGPDVLVLGPAVVLRGAALVAVYRAVSGPLRAGRLAGRPLPADLVRLQHDLHRAVTASRTCAVSGTGRDDVAPHGVSAESDPAPPEAISSTEAAAALGCSPRQVQRLAPDLDGRKVAGRWCFDPIAVHDYQQARHRAA